MIIKHRIYKIQEQDTIKSIAKKLNLDLEELKNYHNNKSNLNNIIFFSIPEHVTELIVPAKDFILKKGKEIWVGEGEYPIPFNLSYSRKFFNTVYIGDLNYAVFKTIKTGETTSTIKYNMSIRFYPESKKENLYVSIDVISKTYINNAEPDLVADELALACTKVLYPLILQVDHNGLILDIQNHKAILKRWEVQKKKNLSYYKGNTAQKYFQLFEQTLSVKNLLLHHLENDWFCQLYFNTIYTTYTNNYDLNRTLEFPILPHTKGVQFNICQEVDKYLKNNHIKVELKGDCTDVRSRADLENGSYFPSNDIENLKPVEGNYRALYFFHPKTKKIESAFLECHLKLKKEKYVSVSISKIKDTIEDEDKRHPSEIIEIKEKKESFLKMLFS